MITPIIIPTIDDQVQDDGSVVRTTTYNYPNGDTDVRTHTFTADEYQVLQNSITTQITNLQNQISILQTTQTTIQANIQVSQAKVSTLKTLHSK